MEKERPIVKNSKDSVLRAKWDSLNGESFRNVQEKRIKLGLDLRGGMYITMEVDAVALLQESAMRDAIDATFEEVITKTREEAKNSDEPVIDIFKKHFNEIAKPKGKTLASYYDFGNLGSADNNDDGIYSKLTKNIEDAVDQALEVVRQRIDKYGVAEPTIQKQGTRRIILELPGVSDEKEIRSLISTTARLEFKLVKNDKETALAFKKIDDLLAGKNISTADTTLKDSNKLKVDTTKKDINKKDTLKKETIKKDSLKKDTNKIAKKDSTKKDSTKKDSTKKDTTKADTAYDPSNPYKNLPKDKQAAAYQKDHPFTTLFLSRVSTTEEGSPQDMSFIGNEFPKGEYFFSVPKSKIQTVKNILARNDVKGLIPEGIIFAFSDKAEYPDEKNPDGGLYGMYAINKDPELTGEVITDASPSFDQNGRPVVTMQMDADGAEQWGTITGKNIKNRIAVVLDSAVYSAPTVQNKITGGNSQISGSKDTKEAQLLSTVLKAGALKAPVSIIEERVVGASLGDDSISQGINSTLLAALLVIVFMLMYYVTGGVIADIGVILNLIITIAALASMGLTLSLPGIAGLVLTIGMAVDANILIYERIREELALAKPLKTAVNLGFDRAFTAIIDTHLTTIGTGVILYLFGSGPIKGFAVTLVIGLLATLLTAVFATRAIFSLLLERGTTDINLGQPKNS